MEISLTNTIGAILAIGLRVSGLMIFAPFIGSPIIPPRIKAVLVLAITAVLYPVYHHQVASISWAKWPLVFMGEMLIGVGMGIVTNIVFEAAQLAGQVLSIQVGYSLVNILDPTTQVESTVIGVFQQTLVMMIFLSMKEIASVLQIAESRVSQIHALAIPKIRVALQESAFDETNA